MELQTSGQHPLVVLFLAAISGISGMFAAISANIDLWIRGGSFIIALASGLMAVRYYYYATKKLKQEIKD